MNHNLDGCYFRVQRDGKWQSICFSDLTAEERSRMFDNVEKPAEWWKSLAYHLADCLQQIGEQCGIYHK